MFDQIEEIPKEIKYLTQLTKLYLWYNQKKDIKKDSIFVIINLFIFI